MQNYFSTNLKFLRLRKQLSQNKLAQKIGVNSSTINRWEENTMSPNVEKVEMLANFFNVSVNDIICKDLRLSTEIKKVGSVKELLEDIVGSDLSDEEYDNIMDFIKNNKGLFIKDKDE